MSQDFLRATPRWSPALHVGVGRVDRLTRGEQWVMRIPRPIVSQRTQTGLAGQVARLQRHAAAARIENQVVDQRHQQTVAVPNGWCSAACVMMVFCSVVPPAQVTLAL